NDLRTAVNDVTAARAIYARIKPRVRANRRVVRFRGPEERDLVGVSAAAELELRQDVIAQAAPSLGAYLIDRQPAALVAVEIEAERRAALNHAGVRVIVDGRRAQQPSDMQRALRKSRSEIDVDVDRGVFHFCLDTPAREGDRAPWHLGLSVRADGELFGLSH